MTFSSPWPLTLSGLSTLLMALLVGCSQPPLDARLAELGPEDEGFEPSALHRPGQPCVLCHGQYEGAEPELSIGGTLFSEPVAGEMPGLVANQTIRLYDSEGKILELKTNECGNFFATRAEHDLAFPLRAELWGPSAEDDESLIELSVMSTRIGRDGSCGSCHRHPASSSSPGVVYVPASLLKGSVTPPAQCPPPRFAELP